MKRKLRRSPPTPAPAPKQYLQMPETMLDGLTRRSSKTKLFDMLAHAVAVAEAWKLLAQQAQSQEQRTYLAFVKATRGPK